MPPTCFTPPTGHVPLRSVLPGQCLLLADHNLMDVPGSLWLDGLYVRLTSPRGVIYLSLISSMSGTETQLWMTGVTLQGNGDGVFDCWVCGMLVTGSLHANGAVLSNTFVQHECMI